MTTLSRALLSLAPSPQRGEGGGRGESPPGPQNAAVGPLWGVGAPQRPDPQKRKKGREAAPPRGLNQGAEKKGGPLAGRQSPAAEGGTA